jgi:hypothetical protein
MTNIQNTDPTKFEYVKQIRDAYDAGVSNNETRKNDIINNVYKSLPSECKNYVRSLDSKYTKSIYSGTLYGSIFSNYKNDVESANTIPEKILADEREYFTKKYSDSVYNYLLTQRERNFSIKNAILEQLNYDASYSDLQNIIGNNDLNLLVTNSMDSKTDTENRTMVDMFNKFSKYMPETNPELTYRKIQYRDMEHDKLKWINNMMNIVYYSLLITLFLILYSSENLHFKERFLLYFFLIIAPLIFPFVYNFIKKIFNWFGNSVNPIHGPKNAFLNSADDHKPIFDGHNI